MGLGLGVAGRARLELVQAELLGLGARAGGGRGAALLGDGGAVGQPSDGGEAGGERVEWADAAQRGERRHLLKLGGRERAARLGRCREMW